jgi:hypothetical protein
MKIIAYSIANGTIACSDGTTCDTNWVDFLLKDKGDAIKVFDQLDYCVAKLLKHIGLHDDFLKKLYKTGDLYFQGFKYQYVPHKWFSIKYGGFGYAGFSDMGQYSQDLFNFTMPVEPQERARKASEVGQVVFNTLRSLNLHPASLTSPVGIWAKEVLDKSGIPTCTDVPDEVNLYAYQCTHGGWLEVFKKGYFEQSWDYDVIAAYGSYVAKLLDTRFGMIVRGKEYEQTAEYGYCFGKVTITSPFSPIALSNSRDECYTPIGEWETYLTKGEIDFIRKYELGTFEIYDGYWLILNKKVKPFEAMINKLFEEREKRKRLERDVVKRIISGIWGMTGRIDDDGKLGKRFHPVWFAEVESQNRLEVARFVLDNNLVSDLLSIAVDGVLVAKPVPSVKETGSMGQWKLSANCPSIVVSSGVVAVKDRVSTGPFSLQYDWLIDQIKQNPKASEYKMTKLSPVTLGKAIQQNRIEDLGKLEEITKTVDVTYELKRMYKKLCNNGGNLLKYKYESFPWDASVVMKVKKEGEE